MAVVDRVVGTRWRQYSGDGCRTNEDMSGLAIDAGGTLSSSRAISDAGRFRLRIGVLTPDSNTRPTNIRPNMIGLNHTAFGASLPERDSCGWSDFEVLLAMPEF